MRESHEARVPAADSAGRGPGDRLAGADWRAIEEALDEGGWAVLPRLLDAEACDAVAWSYDAEALFRSRVVMARHGFGRGEYRYFAYPLPAIVAELREGLYPRLAPIANRWSEALGLEVRYPLEHAAFLARCREGGQERPTPLLLRYGPGDFNCLHQDLYGEQVFPLQAAILLSEPGRDFEGGQLVLTEQRPRMQSRVMAPPLAKGDALVFAVNHRPVAGTRGSYRVAMRHGVSEIRRGSRFALGIIFHDAA
jgi:uncharacterized protein